MSDEKKKDDFNFTDNVLLKESEDDKIFALTTELEEFKIKADENFNLFLTARADLDNMKKRTDKEVENIIKYSNKKILLSLLPLIDSVEARLSGNVADVDREGFEIFYNMLFKLLEEYHVEKIHAACGIDFDPLKHEAISIVEHDEYDNKINTVVQCGYILYDQILRYSKVTIFKKKNNLFE